MSSVVSNQALIHTCIKFLQYYDPRLMDHGLRVALIAHRIRYLLPHHDTLQLKTLTLLCLFHDIGAYKTDEVDQMVAFESTQYKQHSIYGYLFLKHLSPLGDAAEAILYHHTPHRELIQIDTPMRAYAELIHLADRIDIGIASGWDTPMLFNSIDGLDIEDTYRAAAKTLLQSTPLCDEMRQIDLHGAFDQLLSTFSVSQTNATAYLKMLAFSIDFKCDITMLHAIATQIISLFIGKRLGLTTNDMEKLYYAALVHDLGKVVTPDSILRSNNPLDTTQMHIMKQHVVYTEEIIAGILPDDIVHMAVRHHEKLDGSGYPRGLTAHDLSTCDRIVAVADIVSALCSSRSYKEQFDAPRCLTILNTMAGQHKIDADIVAVVAQHYDELLFELEEETLPYIALYQTIQQGYTKLLTQTQNHTHIS